MKTKTCIFAILLAGGLASSRAQDTWTRKADFGGTARYAVVAFSIDSKGYLGTGNDSGSTFKSDFWEYDTATDTWAQKADFGGGPREHAASFTIGTKGYVGTGSDGLNVRNDFWEYDPTTNIWTQKANFGGAARYIAVGFSIGSKGYIGTGTTRGCCPLDALKDIWEYDPAADTWTQKADFGGGRRAFATGFSIGGKGYIGTGQDNNLIFHKDFWEFDPVVNTWSQKADFGGTARNAAMGFSIGDSGYIGTGSPDNLSGFKDFWKYDAIANAWTQKAAFGGSARAWTMGFSIGDKAYGGTGADPTTFYRDFWEYTPGEQSSGGCTPPPAGLVSWWSGDRTAEDVQGANPGSLVGGTSFKEGIVGPGFLFDGINDGVVIPNSASLSPPRLTIDAWVYVAGGQGIARHIVSKDNAAKTREYILGIGSENSFVADVWLPSGLVDLRNTTTAKLNTWYHLAMTQDGQKLRLYVNGLLDGSADAVGNIVVTLNPVGIGLNVDQALSPFQGVIDEVQIFDRALTDSEILAIYQTGTEGQCKPVVFVEDLTPYAIPKAGGEYKVGTTIQIMDAQGHLVSGAIVRVTITLPDGGSISDAVTTDSLGNADYSIYSTAHGTYVFTVERVAKIGRQYRKALNVETRAKINIL